MIRSIDLTSLNDDDTDTEIEELCTKASTRYGPVAAVCVWPRFVRLAANLLSESRIRVAAVANFPHGDNDPDQAVADARYIVESGGNEVDVVFPWRFLEAGSVGVGTELVAATREAIGPDVTLKVIIESGELREPALIASASEEALLGGADFLKTSTGKTGSGATLVAATEMLRIISDHTRGDRQAPIGLKISGGLKAPTDVLPFLHLVDDLMGPAWRTPATFRIGASSLLQNVLTDCVLAEPDMTP